MSHYKHFSQPRSYVIDFLEGKQSGNALDIGAGLGNNTAFLLEKDFIVTAIDNNPESVRALQKLAAKYPEKLQILQDDIRDINLAAAFDVIIATMVLHFLKNVEIAAVIRKLQNATKSGGMNIVSAHLDCIENDSLPSSYTYKLKPGELLTHYNDWNILMYAEESPPSSEGQIVYKSAKLVAQKKGSDV